MSGELEKKLAMFLKRKMGEDTFAHFARQLGLSPSTLHRLLNLQQSPTFELFQDILRRLKCSYKDVFETDLRPSTAQEDPKSKLPPSPSGVKYPKKKRRPSKAA